MPRRRLAIAAVLGAAVILAFLPALRAGFVNWDDPFLLLGNEHFRGFGAARLRWMLTTFYMGPYQPLCWLSFAADFALWGLRPLGYHLTNVLLHAAAALAMFAASRRLLARARPKASAAGLDAAAALAALLFAVHPLRAESVAWVSERRDVLSGALWLSALAVYLGESRRRIAVSLSLFILSLLAKASGMALPLVLLVLDAYPLRRRAWLEKLPFFAAAAAAAGVAALGQAGSGAMRPWAELGAAPRLAISAYAAVFYLWKTLAPLGLSPLYERAAAFNPTAPVFLLCGAAVAGATAALVAARRRAPAALAAWACYLLLLAPVSGLVTIGPSLAADRYSYLPCLGWAVLAASPLTRLSRARLAAAGALVAALIGLTFRQSRFWTSSERLWTRALAVNEASPIAHNNLGFELERQGRLPEALRHYERAIELNPVYHEAKDNVCRALPPLAWAGDPAAQPEALRAQAVALATARRLPEALDRARWALCVAPRDAKAVLTYGMILADLGRLDESAARLSESIQLDPRDPEARRALAIVEKLRGRGH